MSRLRGHSGFHRRAVGLAIALVVVGQVPCMASADPLFSVSAPFTLDLTWAASLAPVASAPADAPEPPPLLHFGDAPNQRLSQATPSPGLQLLLNPDDEEVFLGWQFEF